MVIGDESKKKRIGDLAKPARCFCFAAGIVCRFILPTKETMKE
jgi:hypothetical protein